MTYVDEVFLKTLESYMHGKSYSPRLTPQQSREIIVKARNHKVLPAVFSILSNSLALGVQELGAVKKEALFQITRQVQNDGELVRVCGLFENAGIEYILFKGAVLRSLYAEPEYRISADEDFLMTPDGLSSARKLLEKEGYSLFRVKDGEVNMICPKTAAVVELHTDLFFSENEAQSKVSDMLNSQLGHCTDINFNGYKIKTFYPEYGFLALLVHLFRHFMRGGIGIRQVMDIAVFYSAYKSEIDVDKICGIMENMGAGKLAQAVFYICQRWFKVDFGIEFNSNLAQRVLDDMLLSGAYGNGEKKREHGGAVTKKIVKNGSSVTKAVFRTLYPTDEQMISKYPFLSEDKSKIPSYRVKRIIKFLTEKDGGKTAALIIKRRKILKDLDII